MGIIERQSKNNLLILVFAVFFGALNNVVLFPIALNKEEWGIIRFLPTIAIIVSNIALLGVPQILLKYMPTFKKDGKSNNGLLFFCLSIAMIGLSALVLLLYLFKGEFMMIYEENASRLEEYYIYLFPLIVLTVLTELLSAFSRAHLFSVFQLFLREILHRIVQSVLLTLVLFNLIDFNQFVLLYSFSQLFNLIFLLYFLWSENILDVRPVKIESKKKGEMLKFGGANFLTSLGATLTGRFDSLMIAALVSGAAIVAANGGLEAVAIYSFGAYIVTIVEMPARAVSSIANGIVAKAWAENDLEELSLIYRKTSINQLLIGGLLFALIWAGIDELFELVGGYEEAKWIVLFLGLGKMIVVVSGAASSIIVGSKESSNVLEVGCGIGTVSSLIINSTKNGQFLGCDISPHSIKLANELYQTTDVNFKVDDMSDFKTAIKFDFIVFPDVLEHIPVNQHSKLFENVSKTCKENAKVLINIPEPNALNSTRINQPEVLQIIDQSLSMQDLLNNTYPHGFQVQSITPYSIHTDVKNYLSIVLIRDTKINIINRNNKFYQLIQNIKAKYL